MTTAAATTETTPVSDMLATTMSIVRAARKAGLACDRPDLVERLDELADRLTKPDSSALVMGEFKQGKSSLINALLATAICPVDDDLATTVPTVLYNSPTRRATSFADDGDAGPLAGRSLPLDAVPATIVSGALPQSEATVRTVEIGLPHPLLAQGLRLIDTPGVGGIDSRQGQATRSILPIADAVLFVSDASQELTASEIEALTEAHQRCGEVVCVVSKIDLYPRWREVLDRNQRHLERAGVSIQTVAVSSSLRCVSLDRNDHDLLGESRFGCLLGYLTDHVITRKESLRCTDALRQVEAVVHHLRHALKSEQHVLLDPEHAASLADEAEAARVRLESLRSATARWSTLLGDGIRDLQGSADHDLRMRTRAFIADMESEIDETDPSEVAEELFSMAEQRLMTEVTANHDLTCRGAAELAQRVDQVFAVDALALFGDTFQDPTAALLQVGGIDATIDERPTSFATVLTALRGSYGGMAMFGGLAGVLGNAAAVGALGPVGLAVGAALGRRAAKDERERQLTLRRQQTKTAIKKYVETVSLRASKHGRDTVQAVHRELRDATLGRAAEMSTTAAKAARSAAQAAESAGPDREQRLQTISRMLEGLAAIENATTRELTR